MPTSSAATLELPISFTFNRRGLIDFDVLRYFDWDYDGDALTIDLTGCMTSHFQALALLIQYAWHLTLKGCAVTFKYGTAQSGPTKMLAKMGALRWRDILANDGLDFGHGNYSLSRKTFALRRRSDIQSTINNARKSINDYVIGFPPQLHYCGTAL